MVLSIVVPCYNEEAVLRETDKRLFGLVSEWISESLVQDCHIVYVDDGSKDSTWDLIRGFQKEHPFVNGIKLAHNAGHQHALWAGLMWSLGKCDAVITIDADLQQDIHAIKDMVSAYQEGFEVVYGVRNDRGVDSEFKKRTALAYYSIMRKMGVDLIPNHADFRLLGSKALKALSEYEERNLFLRGMVRSLGFKEKIVHFECYDRFAGESKYTLRKMMNFAIDGITSFSVRPLRLITMIGMVMLVVSVFAGIYVLVTYFCGNTIKGWTSILLSIWFLGGIQLLCIGIIGEYIGRNYIEVKRRPLYIIEEVI